MRRTIFICSGGLLLGLLLGCKSTEGRVDSRDPFAAYATNLAAVTLTTFRTIPWNCPFYERLGFRTLDETELSPRLTAVLDEEAGQGLARDARCAMQLTI